MSSKLAEFGTTVYLLGGRYVLIQVRFGLHSATVQPTDEMKSRLHNIDALRGIAALAVALFHFTNGNGGLLPDGSALKWAGSLGYLGVPIFFAISGFIIPYAMASRDYHLRTGWVGFLKGRVLRIEPAYLGSIVLTVALVIASAITPGSRAKFPDVPISSVLAHIAYLAPWMGTDWLQPVYWSLAIEFQYYLVMLLAAPALISKSPRPVRVFLAVAFLLALLPSDPRLMTSYLPLFGMGFSAFVAQTGRLRKVEALLWATSFLAAGMYTDSDNLVPLSAAVGTLLIILPTRRAVPIFGALGTISYSLYLVHVPVGGRVINLAVRSGSPIVHVLAVPAALAASLLAAYVFWRIFEVAVPEWLRTRADRLRSPDGQSE